MEEYLVTHPVRYLLYDHGKAEEVSGHIVDVLRKYSARSWMSFLRWGALSGAIVIGQILRR